MKLLQELTGMLAEGSDASPWRVEQSDATGRYYVVKGYYGTRKVWANEIGAIDFNKKEDAEAKAEELNKGVAEGSKEAPGIQGTPVVSLSDFDDKDTKKDKYGRSVPKSLKKDDPRVKFHKDQNADVVMFEIDDEAAYEKVMRTHSKKVWQAADPDTGNDVLCTRRDDYPAVADTAGHDNIEVVGDEQHAKD